MSGEKRMISTKCEKEKEKFLSGAIENTDFIKYSLEFMGECSANDGGGIHGFHPLHTAPSLLVAT